MKTIIFLMFSIAFLFVSCNNNNEIKKIENKIDNQNSDVVELIYFHGTQRCATCTAVETVAKEVIDSLYQNEIKTGKLTFKVVDFSEKENEELANKYEVAFSSLIIDKNGQKEDLTDIAFGNAKARPEVFKEKLAHSINHLLK